MASLNLSHDRFNNSNGFSFEYLSKATREAVRYLDNTGSMNHFPTLALDTWYTENRPVGLGVMGFADLLLRLGIKYGNEESYGFMEDIMKTMKVASYEASEQLGKERGVPIKARHVNRRNITTLSIAPTGSIAMIAGCSHSLEPIFGSNVIRTDERGETYFEQHPMSGKNHFVTANEIPWQDHVRMLASAQKHVDAGVSKTINMASDATVNDVLEAYKMAWELNCKGVTVYRDKSRETQVLEHVKTSNPPLKVDDGLSKEMKAELLASCPTGICEI